MDAAERLLQIVRGDVGEIVELTVRLLELVVPDLQLALGALALGQLRRELRGAFGDAVLQRVLGREQRSVTAFDLRQHVIERGDEHPDFVLPVRRRSQRVVLVCRNRPRRIGQPQQGIGHEPLKPRRQEKRQEPRGEQHQRHRQDTRPQPLVQFSDAAPHVNRADPCPLSTIGPTISTAPSRSRSPSVSRPLRWSSAPLGSIHRKKLAIRAVNPCGRNLRLRFERPQCFRGCGGIVELERRRSVVRNDGRQCLQIVTQVSPEAHDVPREQHPACEHERNSTRGRDDGHELAADRQVAQPLNHRASPSSLRTRMSLELICRSVRATLAR